MLTLTNAYTATGVTPLRRASARFGSGPSRAFTIADRRTARVRHRHKYVDTRLSKEQRFYFTPPTGRLSSQPRRCATSAWL